MRWSVIEQIEAMLAKGVTPLVPAQGSVGASGDLAPLAHMTAVMIGEGEAEFDGRTMPGAAALAAAGLRPIALGPKEGLALINGTQFSTAFALVGLHSQAEGDLRAFENRVLGWPVVREAHMLSGEIDYLLRCLAPDLATFQAFVLDDLTAAPNVASVKTYLTIRRAKLEPGVPVPTQRDA